MAVLQIRRYAANDEDAVRRLALRLTEGFAPWRDKELVARSVAGWVDEALRTADEPDHAVLVADLEGHGVVGFVGVTARAHYIAGRDAYIGELSVDSAVEGKGVGRQLVAAVEAWAEQHGCERITLQTGAANQRARGFYEELGFQYEDVSMARAIIT